ncbi:MAG: SIR2 family protein, partial [Roseiarcus sp.]
MLDVYQALDASVHSIIVGIPRGVCNQWEPDCSSLTYQQRAEVKRFTVGDYDVVLGMLERRLDNETRGDSRVRREVGKRLRLGGNKPAPIHHALIRLADRGGAVTIVTTNFDLLLEAAGKRLRSPVETYALGSIPRPTGQTDFAGVLHIHGALEANSARVSELVLSDQDFGEFYLRRRVVPDFIYDAARLFHLVLVGYSANDPPMRYLLNAVAADGTRFADLKERFTFFGTSKPDPVALEDWKARGITPIHYDARNSHSVLRETLEQWAELSAVNGKKDTIDAVIRRIVAPRLKIDPIDSLPGRFIKRPRRPKTFNQLLSASLTSGDLVDLNVLELARLSEVPFLTGLANALEATVSHGLDIARRIGWDGKRQLWRLGLLNRVNYTQNGRRAAEQPEPDAYHHGIAPSTKLLHAVVSRIAELEAKAALPFVQRWRFADSPIHIRLWAATARNPQLVTVEEVGQFLLGLDDRQFWDLNAFPEIAELRALSYGALVSETQKAIVTRLRNGPPRDYWPKKADAELVKNVRTDWAVREFKRIEVAGSELPPDARSWVQSRNRQFPDLAEMTIDAGFPQAVEVHAVAPNPDDRYDTLVGAFRPRRRTSRDEIPALEHAG